MTSSTARRWAIVLSVLAATGVIAALVAVTDYTAARASLRYDSEREQLSTDLRRARAEGYSTEDLKPITGALQMIQLRSEPLPPLSRAEFDERRADELVALDAQLKARLQQVVARAGSDSEALVRTARSEIDQDKGLGATDAEVAPLQQRLDKLVRAENAAHTLSQLRAVDRQAQSLIADIKSQAAAQEALNRAVAQAAGQLKAESGGSSDAVREAGVEGLASGRNDASIAAYMNRAAPFRGYDGIGKLVARLERYGQMIASADPDQSALGAAGARLVAGQVHGALLAGLPAKVIILSYTDQHLWAYQKGKLVQETPVTTGRPALPTDLGPMKVLRKDSPGKMHSPWPKGSPYWYPDTMVKMVVWFTRTGEGLHDADWQRCCWGPGSQYTANASHGCVHVPDAAESFVYRWAELGTPVIVYQGDGSPVSQQLSKITTDNHGNPLTGPRGI